MPRRNRPLDQAAVEQATGLSREVLRKWEQRYQFPKPLKGERGQRIYTAADLARLQDIVRLINRGQRVGKVIALPPEELQALLLQDDAVCYAHGVREASATLLLTLQTLAPPNATEDFFTGLIERDGLAFFVDQHLPAFNVAVGEAWAAGSLGVHGEHRYSEIVTQVVLRALPAMVPESPGPRVLLTTPPGEAHALGLLGVRAALALAGAPCISLGTQTPAADAVRAVHDLNVGILGISISVHPKARFVRQYMQELRAGLPPTCQLWAGGRGAPCLQHPGTADIQIFSSTRQAVQVWSDLARASGQV